MCSLHIYCAKLRLYSTKHTSVRYISNLGKVVATLEELKVGVSVRGLSPDGIAKVHVHMEDPGVALSAGVSYGQISNIEIANMDEQAADWAADR